MFPDRAQSVICQFRKTTRGYLPFAEEASERTAGLIGGAAKKRQGLIYHLREVGSILAACGVPETDDKELFAKLRAVRTRSQAIICQITQITAGVWEEG